MHISVVSFTIDGSGLTLQQIELVANKSCTIQLAESARQKMLESYNWVQQAGYDNKPIYGVNTGFGSLARVSIPPSQSSALSRNLIRSHAAGVGPIADEPTTRVMMVLRANALENGVSGCGRLLVKHLLLLFNQIFSQNTDARFLRFQWEFGATCPFRTNVNLNPEGEAIINGETADAPPALSIAGLEPLSWKQRWSSHHQWGTAINCYSNIEYCGEIRS